MISVQYGKPADMPPREKCVGFTGHRPKLLPWGDNEADPRCIALKKELASRIEREYRRGARFFLSGMAEGVDMYAAELVLLLSQRLPDIKLIAVFPYGRGNSVRQRRAADAAERVVSLGPRYVTGCMAARDRFLVNSCSAMICVLAGGGQSGTASTMAMALDEGVRMTVLRV